MLTKKPVPPIVKSGDAIATPARDQITLRILVILVTISVIVAVATMLARL